MTLYKASLPWADGGKPFKVRPMPFNGQREYQVALHEQARVFAAQRSLYAIFFHGVILEAKRVLDKKGPEVAKAAWENTLKSQNTWRKEFEWDLAEWPEKFNDFYEGHTLKSLNASNYDEALKTLNEKAEAVNKEVAETQASGLALGAELALIETYWRLKASGIKTITPEGSDPIPLDWSPASRETTMALLGDYADDETVAALRPQKKAAEDDPLDMSDFHETDEEAVRGKSQTASEISTPSNGDSTPSSESPSETPKPLEANAT